MSTILTTRWIVGLAVPAVFVAYLAISSQQTSNTEVKPSLRRFNDVCEIGRTSLRKKWRVPFQIGNSGKKRLVINKIDATCCGDSTSETITIPPGETVEVTVDLDTRFAYGVIENVATFTTSDPECPRFDLTARAWIIEETISPSPARPRQAVSVLIRN